jgi:SAM domain (Sterile alpha motif)
VKQKGINLTAILVRYSPVLPHRQPLATSRGNGLSTELQTVRRSSGAAARVERLVLPIGGATVREEGASMHVIADWLEKLGMSEYTQRFVENGIDFAVLHDLTDQDLKDIGVLLGHRRKLLRAIAELEEVEERSAEGGASRCHIGYTARCRRAPPNHGDVL